MIPLHGRLLVLALALTFWLIGRPFRGIWHDGKFYALQALQHLNPSVFSKDLFFLYGSQDQYSFFSPVYAAAISLWGLMPGTMALQGLGLGLWFMAAWALTRALPARPAVLALLLIAALGSQYGSHGVFAYGESFLTARLYAEALSLAGLAAWLTGRRAWGGVAFAAAFAMHPVMALPAAMIGLGVMLRPRVWFSLMGGGALLALGLGAMGVAPFNGLLQPMDAVWAEFVRERTPHVFLDEWERRGFSKALFVVVVTATAWRILPPGGLRRLAWATLVCVLGAFALAWLGGSLLKLPLIAGLQLTRVMWIGLVVSLILIPAMLWENRQGDFWNRVLVWGLALVAFLSAETQGVYALIVLAVFLLGRNRAPHYKPTALSLFILGLIALLVVLSELLDLSLKAEWTPIFAEAVWRNYFSNSMTALVLAAGAYWLLGRDRLSKPLVWSGTAVTAGFLALALLSWNDLPPEQNYGTPARQAAIAPIAARVPVGATVYWMEDHVKAWFWLGRANYLSFSQTAGSVFSRGTAVEAKRRAAYAAEVSLQDSNQTWAGRLVGARFRVSEPALRQVCSDPVLDFVIANSGPKDGGLYFKDPLTGRGYALHDCREVRASGRPMRTTNAVKG